MKYFLHDTNAFQDERITELFIQHGYEGLGLFYTILEKLGAQEKPIKTAVLKRQLSVGKKLEKVWSFLEKIELISSNNGETFNNNLLKFSENYKIKKEKTRERVAQFRENQAVAESVTRYNHDCNTPKVKESKVKESKVTTVSAANAAHAQPPPMVLPDLRAEHQPAETSLRQHCLDHYNAHPEMYTKQMYVEFLAYWLAPVQNGPKAQLGKENWRTTKAWSLSGRLATWHRNNLSKNPTTSTSTAHTPTDYTAEFESFFLAYGRPGSNKRETFAEWVRLSPANQAKANSAIEGYKRTMSDLTFMKPTEKYLKEEIWANDFTPPPKKMVY